MKSITFSLFLIAILIFSIGCDSTICTDSFCIVPRGDVDGDVIEVDETKVLALIARTPESELITLEPITPQAVIGSPTFADIVSDVTEGNTTYLNQIVTITGYAVWKSDQRDAILIHTTNNPAAPLAEGVLFFVTSYGDPAPLNPYSVGNEYTFTVTIILISPPEEAGKAYAIASILAD